MEKNNGAMDHKLIELVPLDMNAPVEVLTRVHVLLPDLRGAVLEFRMEIGMIPTRSAIQDVVDACLDPGGNSGIPPGTRMLTKKEFMDKITLRETGQVINFPGDQEFVPSIIEVPRQILIDAINWAHVEANPGTDVKYDTDAAMRKHSDAELMAIYKGLVNGQ